MQNEKRTVSDTVADFDDARHRRRDQSDWAYVDALTEEELEASIDIDEEGTPNWSRSWLGIPPEGEQRRVWVDADVIDWFAASGDGRMSRLNDVLRAYVDARQHADPAEPVVATARR